MTDRVPYSHAPAAEREAEYISEVLRSRALQARGAMSRRCEGLIKEWTGAAVNLTHSGTAALEVATLILDLKPGDEVIMPSFAFASIANAVVLRGAIPVFVDIREDTFNLDETRITDAVSEKTRAVFVVHYAGVGAEMDVINQTASRFGLAVVEDAAQAYLATYRGLPLGALSAMGCFSFHETKNVVSGEGGAIVTTDLAIADRITIVCEKGTNRQAFLKGTVDKYTWLDVGSSFHPGELVAALLLAQLEYASALTADRLNNWDMYFAAFEPLEKAGLARRPRIPAHCGHNGHIFHLLLKDVGSRDRLIDALRRDGIVAPFHYVPLHSAPAGRRFGKIMGSMAVTNAVAECQIRLPLYSGMGRDKVARVIERVLHHMQA